MKKYIAILRGINVGGKRKILMADLKVLLTKMGLQDITTYIQSGNIVFFSNLSARKIEETIKQAIFKKYGFDVPVMIRTSEEIKIIFNNNPFLPNEKNIDKLYVTFLSENPVLENIDHLKKMDFNGDQFVIDKSQVYLFFSEKYSKSKLSNNLIESKLKVTATTRNWKTVRTLFEMVSNG